MEPFFFFAIVSINFYLCEKIESRMNSRLFILFLVFAGYFVSCARETDTPASDVEGQLMVFRASWADEQSSRTFLQENGKDIWWTPGEEISMFFGDKASGMFVSNNSEPAAVADFEGSLPIAVGSIEQENSDLAFWAVYPYNTTNSCDGRSVTLSVASSQQAVAGTFANNFFPSIARNSSYSLAFWNICGGARFSIVQEGVQRLVFRSCDASSMAGRVKVGFGEDNKPQILDIPVSVDSVEVFAPEGGFIPGVQYFAALLPQLHTEGITVSLYTPWKKAIRVIEGPVNVKRSVFGILDNVDEGLEYIGPDLPPFIVFADSLVRSICVENFDLDGDGEVNYEEAASVDSLKTLFQKSEISMFEELAYFTGLSEIPNEAFLNCSNLEKIALPDSLLSIGDKAFAGCSSLREIDLSVCTMLKNIGASAFANAASDTITIPAAVTSIGSKAFAPFKCVRLYAEIPPTIASDTFNANARFGVPDNSLKRYKTKKLSGTIWGKCANWIYSNDSFSYPPSLTYNESTGRWVLKLFGYTLDFIKVSHGSYTDNGNSVTISEDYWLAETEYTRALWMAVKKDDPSYFQPTYDEAINCPVTYVPWEEVNSFIASLKQLVPGDYYLPTEAQWRFAAKGGNQSRNYTYSGSSSIENVAWYRDNSYTCLDTTGLRIEQPHPVKTKAKNELGFYDMSGNVAEWASDYYGSSTPKGTDPTGPKTDAEKRRVILGGDYISMSSGCQVTSRYYAKQDVLRSNVGFRLALRPPSQQ